MAGAAAVEFRAVVKRYGAVTAVAGVSFEVAAGKLVTLLGPSGCGKTTVLRLIAGLELASEGQILIGGEDVTRRGAAERDVSMVFQSYALFPHMNVLDNVMYGPLVAGAGRAKAEAMARDKLAQLGLSGFEARLPSELSGGQQQRVAVARAIVLEPAVLLFDEPLSNLDARLRRKVRDDIRDLQQRLGLTVVYVTHDQEEALAVSDSVIVMDRGEIAQAGPPQALYERPGSRFIADFIGEANIVDGAFARGPDGAHFEAEGVRLPLGPADAPDGPGALALRPDRIRLRLAPGSALTVRRQAYVGHAREYVVTAPWGDLLVVRPAHEPPLPDGAAVALDVDEGAAVPLPAAPEPKRNT